MPVYFRAFPGKVDMKGNATNIEAGAISPHSPRYFMVNLIGKRIGMSVDAGCAGSPRRD